MKSLASAFETRTDIATIIPRIIFPGLSRQMRFTFINAEFIADRIPYDLGGRKNKRLSGGF